MNKRSILIIFGIAAALRVAFVWTQPLWYDENFSLLLARLPLDRMLAATISDVHPPLWYFILWPLMHIPAAPALIRIPSVLFSLLSVGIFWAILQKLVSRPQVRMAALVLMAVAPVNIYYAQEGRMYALLEFLVLMALWNLLERKWSFLAMDIILMLYTHNAGMFYAAALFGIALLRDRNDWRKLTMAYLTAGLVWLPWAAVILTQMGAIENAYWILPPAPGRVIYSIYESFLTPSKYVATEILQSIVFFGWILFAGFYLLRNRDKEIRPFLILAFAPALFMVIVSLVWQPIFMYRLLIPSLPFLCVILSWPVEWITANRRRALVAAIFIVPVMALSLLQSYDPHYARGEDGRITDLLETIDSNWQPGDVVYHISDGTLVNYLPYAKQSVGRNFIIPKCDAMFGSLSEQTRTALGVSTETLSDLTWTRAWIATVQDTPIEPACKMQAMHQYLSGQVQVVQCLSFELGRVCLYLVTHAH